MTPRVYCLLGRTAPLMTVLLALLVGLSSVGVSMAVPDFDQLSSREELLQVFLALQHAESRGANVTSTSLLLNQALALIRLGDPESMGQATSIIASVNSTIPQLIDEAEQGRLHSYIALFSFLAALGAVGALSYLYLPRLIWRSWARSRGDWEVAAS